MIDSRFKSKFDYFRFHLLCSDKELFENSNRKKRRKKKKICQKMVQKKAKRYDKELFELKKNPKNLFKPSLYFKNRFELDYSERLKTHREN